eukprot:430750-Rhodomonas_salina.1
MQCALTPRKSSNMLTAQQSRQCRSQQPERVTAHPGVWTKRGHNLGWSIAAGPRRASKEHALVCTSATQLCRPRSHLASACVAPSLQREREGGREKGREGVASD